MEREGGDYLLGVGGGGRGGDRIGGMGGDACRRASRARRNLYQYGFQQPRIPECFPVAFGRNIYEPSHARDQRPGKKYLGVAAQAIETYCPSEFGRGAGAAAIQSKLADRGAGIGS